MSSFSEFLLKVRRYYYRLEYTFYPKVELPYIVDQVYLLFEKSLKKDSSCTSLYYHTWFRIYLSSHDYHVFHPDFREIVKRTIQEMMMRIRSDYRFSNDYISHSPAWQFSFVEVCDDAITIDDPTKEEIHFDEKHPIRIIAGRYPDPQKIDKETNSFTVVNNGQLVGSIPLNKNAFKNIEKVGEGNFIAPIDILYSDEVQPVVANTITLNINNGAQFLVNRNRTNQYLMREERLYIAGRNSSSKINGIAVLKIDSDRIVNPHALLINQNGTLRIEPGPNCDVYSGGSVINGNIAWPQGTLLDFAHITTIKNN